MDRKKRRRATRTSDTPDYDRSADDVLSVGSEGGLDGAREVQLDDAPADNEPRGVEFYEAERPPHYGGD